MRWKSLQWLAAFSLALAAHLAIAAGFLGAEGVKIERGPGDGGPVVIGSIMDAVSDPTDMEEAAETEEVEETAEEHTEDELTAEAPPQELTAPEPVKNAETMPSQPVKEVRLPEDIHESVPLSDAVLPPKPEDIRTEKSESMDTVIPSEVRTNTEKADIASLKPERMESVKPESIKSEPLKEIPPPKLKKIAKKKKSKPRTAKLDTRRGSAGGNGRSGGGGRGLGGKALQSNYQGRVIAHLRRYKSYPREAKRRRLKGMVRVKFTLNASGRVVSSRLVAGSGSSVLDAGARRTIRRANPFPPFPRGLGKRRMTFVVPIRFTVR